MLFQSSQEILNELHLLIICDGLAWAYHVPKDPLKFSPFLKR